MTQRGSGHLLTPHSVHYHWNRLINQSVRSSQAKWCSKDSPTRFPTKCKNASSWGFSSRYLHQIFTSNFQRSNERMKGTGKLRTFYQELRLFISVLDSIINELTQCPWQSIEIPVNRPLSYLQRLVIHNCFTWMAFVTQSSYDCTSRHPFIWVLVMGKQARSACALEGWLGSVFLRAHEQSTADTVLKPTFDPNINFSPDLGSCVGGLSRNRQ